MKGQLIYIKSELKKSIPMVKKNLIVIFYFVIK